MPIDMVETVREPNPAERLETVFLRGVALVLIVFALGYWLSIIGLYPERAPRFDLMAEHWQIASATLAVLMPVAAIGLWGMFPWGVFLWFSAVVIETIMYLGLPQLFGKQEIIVLFHLLAVLAYLILKTVLVVVDWRHRRPRPAETGPKKMRQQRNN